MKTNRKLITELTVKSSHHLQSYSVQVQRRTIFAGNSAQLLSDVIDYTMLSAQRLLAGNSFNGKMTCDLEVVHKSVRCWGKQ